MKLNPQPFVKSSLLLIKNIPSNGSRRILKHLFFVSFICLFCLSHSFAQERASINGYISDSQSGETLLMANVALLEINKGTSSNTSGYYSLTNVEPGTYTLVATYIGYRRFETDITLEPGENRRLNIELTPEGVQFDEIVVESEAEREDIRNIGTAQVATQLIKELPAVIEPDVFRSIQLLPGVKAASDFSSGLYIRGGGPDQTLILLDETTVYNPTHFFGFFSTFNPDAVKDVRLYKGGYPAEYGGRIGSVLTVYNKDGNRNKAGGSVSLGMLASRLFGEGPVAGGRGSWMLALRRSTLEPLLATLRETTDGVPDKFYFYDVNGKINYDLTANDRLSLAFYTGKDHVAIPFQDDALITLGYGNQTISGQWRRIFSEKLFSFVTLTGSRYYNEPVIQLAGTTIIQDNSVQDISLKTDFEYLPGGRHTISAGFWLGSLYLRDRSSFDGLDTPGSDTNAQYLSVYAQDEWQAADKLTFNAGLRLNAFSEGNYLKPEPRLSAEFQPSSTIRLQAAYGRFYQYLTLVTNEAFSGFDTWLTAAEEVPPAYGDQFVLGAKTIPFTGYGLDVEVYFRTMNDLFELDPFVADPAGLEYSELFRFGRGYAYGTELFLEKQAGPVTGFIGYTFGVTRRKFPGFNFQILDDPILAKYYPPKYDRTHDLNATANYQFSRRWSVNAVFSYATGQAYTRPLGRTQISGLPWASEPREVFIVGNVNSSRLPGYHRLDLSFSRTGTFFGLGDAEWQFQIINVYSRRNVWFYSYDFDQNPVERNQVNLLPIIPSISYTVTF